MALKQQFEGVLILILDEAFHELPIAACGKLVQPRQLVNPANHAIQLSSTHFVHSAAE